METALIWGDVATWVTGVATIALFVIGFLQIRNERILRMKSEKELELRNRRGQAERISSWIVTENQDGIWIAVLNQSPQPVYQMIVNVVVVGQLGESYEDHGPAGQVCIAVAPPGQGYTEVQAMYHGMSRRPGVEIGFKDSAGRNWIRKADGDLLEIQESTMAHYEIDLPTMWRELVADLPLD